MELELKTFGPLEIKNEDLGEVEAVVATLGVVDKDRDVILPGAIPNGSKVKLSGYGHDVIKQDAPPVGKGVIAVEGNKAVFRGKFFMSTLRGREAFATVKELGSDGEWSFGFLDVRTGDLTDDWQQKGARRVISKLRPVEASPVFIGAGVGTGTTAVKELQGDEQADEPAMPTEPDAADPPTEPSGDAPTEEPAQGDPSAEDLPQAAKSAPDLRGVVARPVPSKERLTLVVQAKQESLTARLDAVWNAVMRRNEDAVTFWHIREVFDDFVIVHSGERLLRVPYSVGDDGTVTLGDGVEVEVVYRPIGDSDDAETRAAREAAEAEAKASAEQEEIAAVAAGLERARLTALALDAEEKARKQREAAEAAELEAKAARQAAEQAALDAEFERFQRTMRRLGAA